jgi:hypothetical protein
MERRYPGGRDSHPYGARAVPPSPVLVDGQRVGGGAPVPGEPDGLRQDLGVDRAMAPAANLPAPVKVLIE